MTRSIMYIVFILGKIKLKQTMTGHQGEGYTPDPWVV